jgi:hypothetical protein
VTLLLLIALGVGGYVTRDRWLPLIGQGELAHRPPSRATPAAPPPPPAATAPAAPARVAPAAVAPTPPAPAVPPTPAASAPAAPAPAAPASVAPAPAPSAPAVAPAPVVTTDPTLASRQDKLAQQLEALGGRLTQIEQSITELQRTTESLADTATKPLSDSLGALTERVGRVEQVAGQVAAIDVQVRDLAAKSTAIREGYARLNAAVLAVAQLAQAIDAGTPYVRPLAAVQAVAVGDPEMASALAVLEPYAAQGIPTMAALRGQFPAVADAIARAAPTTGGDTWMDRVQDKVLSLVTIRTTGTAAARAGGIDALLDQAQTAVDGGDLATAATLIARIEGPAAAPAADWLQAARLRIDADRAAATLQSQAAARLASARS